MDNIESPKSKMLKGGIKFLWAELKTFNRTKLKALSTFISGYLKLKQQKDDAQKNPGIKGMIEEQMRKGQPL